MPPQQINRLHSLIVLLFGIFSVELSFFVLKWMGNNIRVGSRSRILLIQLIHDARNNVVFRKFVVLLASRMIFV